MALYGATVVRGGDQESLLEAALSGGETFPGTTLFPRPGFTNPFGVEGFKTLAFEIVEQLGRVPDRVYVATGIGDGIYGIWKGFRELRESGAADRTPRIVACQAAGADSLTRAVRSGEPIRPAAEVRTAALSVAEPVTGRQALRAVRESGGDAATAIDAEAVAARHLARRGTGTRVGGRRRRRPARLTPATACPSSSAAGRRSSGPTASRSVPRAARRPGNFFGNGSKAVTCGRRPGPNSSATRLRRAPRRGRRATTLPRRS